MELASIIRCCTLLGALVCLSEAINIPKDYILHADHVCGTTVAANKPVVRLVSDLHLVSRAFCKNGVYNFTKTSLGVYELKGSYTDNSGLCTYKRVPNTHIYTIRVEVYFGEVGGPIHTKTQERIITCTFDQNAAKKSALTHVKEPPFAPKDTAYLVGKKSTSKITLNVVDVRHKIITRTVQKGRYVRLMATTNGANKELGVRPVSCDAVGIPSKKRHSIIRAGCGDGRVFKLGSGFTTEGLKAFSPYFPVFQLEGDKSIDFECNMTICNTNCDGSSCVNARKRRSNADNDELFFIKTTPVVVTYDDPEIIVQDQQLQQDGQLSGDRSLSSSYVTRGELWVALSVFAILIFLTLVTSFYNCFMTTNENYQCSKCGYRMCDCSCNKYRLFKI